MPADPTRTHGRDDARETRPHTTSDHRTATHATAGTAGPGSDSSYDIPTISGYEILGTLGEGGMGRVYRARQPATDRVVAVKVLIAGELASAAARERFRSEITATARLSHPHIVQLFEAGEADGRAFLVCEFVPGGSLSAKLDGTPWDATAAAALVMPLARAAAVAHAAGIVHRDLKPANILLGADGSPKLADFGIAKQIGAVADGQTHTGSILGTPSYMAPEQAGQANTAGPAADVYGLGAILYELLTGRPPFRGKNFVETLDMVRTREPVPPRVFQPRLPHDIETVCLKCLQKDPAKRYATADSLADDLQRLLEGRPILARPVGAIERGWRWARRNPAVAGLLAALVAVTGGGVAALAVQYASVVAANAATGRANDELKGANQQLENEQRAKDRQLLETRRALYLSQFTQASTQAREFHIDAARQLLARCDPEFRGWEWHWLDAEVNATPAIWFPGSARELVVSPDGRTLVGSDGWVVTAWDTDTGAVCWRHEFGRPGKEQGLGLAFHPDGSRVTAASSYEKKGEPNLGRLITLDTRTGKATEVAGPGLRPAYSPDGRYLAYWGEGVQVFDAATGKKVRDIKDEGAVAFTPGGKLAVFGFKFTLYDPATGQVVRKLTDEVAFFEPESVVRFTPDGRWAATLRVQVNAGPYLELRNPAQELPKPVDLDIDGLMSPLDPPAAPFALSPDGKWLAFGGRDGVVRLWNFADPKAPLLARRHTLPLTAVAFSPDARRLYTAGSDGVRMCDMTRDGFREEYGLGCGDTTDPTDPTGASHMALVPNTPAEGELARSADGKWVAKHLPPAGAGGGHAAERSVVVLDAASGAVRTTLVGHTGRIESASFSPDGTRVATAALDNSVRVWDVQTGQELVRLSHSGPHFEGPGFAHMGVRFSADGRHVKWESGDFERYWSANLPPADRRAVRDRQVFDWHFSRALEAVNHEQNKFAALFHIRWIESAIPPGFSDLPGKAMALPDRPIP